MDIQDIIITIAIIFVGLLFSGKKKTKKMSQTVKEVISDSFPCQDETVVEKELNMEDNKKNNTKDTLNITFSYDQNFSTNSIQKNSINNQDELKIDDIQDIPEEELELSGEELKKGIIYFEILKRPYC